MKKIGLLVLVLESFTILILSKNLLISSSQETSPDLIDTEASKIISACQKSGSYKNCYEQQLTKLTIKNNLFLSQKVLYKLWDIDNRTRECHVIAHRIGLAQVRKDPASWNKILGSIIDPESCSGGFFHGILEGHAFFDPTFEVTKSHIESLCGNKDKYTKGSCIHIFGHLLLVESNDDIAKATAICDSLTLSSNDQCYSGVFMEHMTKENLSIHGLATQSNWTKNSLPTFEKLCLGYKGNAAIGCWSVMGHVYAVVYNDDPQIVFDSCKRALQKEFSTNCYLYAAAKMAVTSNSQSNVNSICKSYEGSALFDKCVKRVIETLLQTSPKFYERGEKLCQSLHKKSRINCFENLMQN